MRRRRRHPAQRARVAALVSSIAATVGVGAALARADGGATSSVATSTAAPVAPARAATSTASGAYRDGVYTGPAEFTRWGDVQVQVTISGGRIVAVDEVLAPSDGKSASINSRAASVLESEAIAVQSADIDAVSGATYTSRTYTASLQGALDRAGGATSTIG